MPAAFPSLMQPLVIRGHVLKNRMYASNSMPHFLQGPEPYPAEPVLADLVGRAKAGASIVTITGINTNVGATGKLPATMDVAHFAHFDLYNPQCQNYLMQLADQIHLYQSLASVGLFAASDVYPLLHDDGTIEEVPVHAAPESFETAEGKPGVTQPMMSVGGHEVDDSISLETLDKVRTSFAQQCRQLQALGFDMVTIHMCYRGQLLGQFLSPLTNHRSDSLGGDLAARAAYPLSVLRAIREACGPRFIIEVQITGEETGGTKLQGTVEFLRMCDGIVDIAQIRGEKADPCHPTGFCPDEMPYLDVAARIKAAGVPVAVAGVAGFQDPRTANEAVRQGKLDLVAMARSWISNCDYGKKVAEGRADDIVPCVRCNRCHGRGDGDPFVSVCTVNPLIGLEHRVPQLAFPITRRKHVAVVGGGPGGMRVALMLAERGHEPVVYEAADELGGAIRHADKVDFKWPLKRYKDFLIYQLEKQGIDTHLGCAVTP